MSNLTGIIEEEQSCGVCKLAAPFKCSNCKQIYYCSRDHQKRHWKIHKIDCSAVEVQTSPSLGRFLVSRREANEDDVLFIESPLVFGPKLMDPPPLCLGCYRPLQFTTKARCPRCFWPACDRLCPGLSDPRHHGLECLILSLSPLLPNKLEAPRYEIISPLRTLLLQKRNPNKWQQVLNMEAHMDMRGPRTYAYQYLEEKVVIFLMENYLSKLVEGALLECSREIIHKICGIFEVNALELCFGGRMDLLALYETACTMEHDCLPNTVYHFDSDFRITVQPARKIAKNEHLSTMYTNILWGTQARREHLRETKYFECNCQRCRDPTELGTYISALKCHGVEEMECSGWQLPVNPLDFNSDWQCNVCHVTLSSEEARNLGDMLEQEVESIKKQENISIDKVVEVLNTLEKFLHPHHFQCYEMKHLLIQMYGNKPGLSHKRITTAQINRKIGIDDNRINDLLIDQLLNLKDFSIIQYIQFQQLSSARPVDFLNAQMLYKDLLSVSNHIDPSSGHLTLYIAVLMFELQGALLEKNCRLQIQDNSEIEELLNKTMEILKLEPMNTPGADLRLLAQKTLNEICN